MCARRFLMLIFILTLIVVGGSFAIYQWGGNALIRLATPVGHYQEPPKGAGPDYATAGAWLARPNMDQSANPAEWRPEGYPPPIATTRRVAVFYIHPTTYLLRDRWNAPIAGNGDAGSRARLFVQSQASAFAHIGEVWAPRYRQAAYGAFLLNSADATKALDLAYRDVRTAFDVFLADQRQDSSIILAGHSQGSMHLLRLLADRRQALKGRLIAAYVVGWPVGLSADLPAMGLPACATPAETGCVLSWQSFKEPANPQLVTDAWVGSTGLTGSRRTRDDMLCTNPVTGTANGAAPASANQGTLLPTTDFAEAGLAPARVGARCDKGFLIIDGDIPNLGPYVLPGNNYHVYDYALFWGSIRADAERRVAAWRKR